MKQVVNLHRGMGIPYESLIDTGQASRTAFASFFAKVQNKLHFAIHGPAAELILQRVDSSKERMGLSYAGPVSRLLSL